MNTQRRAALMQRWWGWHSDKPLWLQNGVGRLVCLAYGHEYGRYRWCDWCGYDGGDHAGARPKPDANCPD